MKYSETLRTRIVIQQEEAGNHWSTEHDFDGDLAFTLAAAICAIDGGDPLTPLAQAIHAVSHRDDRIDYTPEAIAFIKAAADYLSFVKQELGIGD